MENKINYLMGADGLSFLAYANKKSIGEVKFKKTKIGDFIIGSTMVDINHRGQNIAGELIKCVINMAQSKGKKIIPVCPYAALYFKRHMEYVGIVTES